MLALLTRSNHLLARLCCPSCYVTGHINHSLFWENLTPQSKSKFPESGQLADQVKADFGSLDELKKVVNATALGIQGSGWAWLAYDSTTKK